MANINVQGVNHSYYFIVLLSKGSHVHVLALALVVKFFTNLVESLVSVSFFEFVITL